MLGRQAMRIETRTREIGREIFESVDTGGPSIFNPRWWDDLVMDWSMADSRLKVQMFRFIDVLPMLDEPDAIAQHLQAYFGTQDHRFPYLVRMGARLSEPGTLSSRVVAEAIRHNVTRLARRFIAGTNAEEVLTAVERMRSEGMTFTLDWLGEATLSEQEADDYLQRCLALIRRLCHEADQWEENPILDRGPDGAIPRVNLSVKVTALDSQFDPIHPEASLRVAGSRLREIFHVAREQGAFINLDMEQYVCKDLTLRIFCELLEEPDLRDWTDVGIAMQAYLPETETDLRALLAWTKRREAPVWVRLVKGAYWDYEAVIARHRNWTVPVYTEKWQTDACFERSSAFLMENHAWLRPAIASQNVRSVAHALAVAEHLRLPRESYELQMLYGMADPLKKVLVDRGERLRIYMPFGELLPGMAYLVRRLLENTSNLSFVRSAFSEETPVEELLRPPASNVQT